MRTIRELCALLLAAAMLAVSAPANGQEPNADGGQEAAAASAQEPSATPSRPGVFERFGHEAQAAVDRLMGRHQPAAPPLTRAESLKLVGAWFALLLVIGLGVLVFAERNLEGVVATLERSGGLARAFWVGLLAEVSLLPLLLFIVLALAITVLGVLLIPFAIVSYAIATAGLLTLGFLAAARFTGQAVVRNASGHRWRQVRALFVGLLGYMLLWTAAAALTDAPFAASVVRAVAFVITWVAVTAGLGATILSRAGTGRPGAPWLRRVPKQSQPDDLAWQTPTPVTGVRAGRRPAARHGT